MLETISQNASIIQAGLLALISILVTIVGYFVKKTYDKADALDQKFLDQHKENLDLRQNFNDHKSIVSESIIKAKLEFTETMDKVRLLASDIRDDLLRCVKAIEQNQEEIKNIKQANILAKQIYQNHNDRIKKSEESLQKISNDLILVKGSKKTR